MGIEDLATELWQKRLQKYLDALDEIEEIQWYRVPGYEKQDWNASLPDCRISISHRPKTGGPHPYNLTLFEIEIDSGKEREFSCAQLDTIQQAKKAALEHLKIFRRRRK